MKQAINLKWEKTECRKKRLYLMHSKKNDDAISRVIHKTFDQFTAFPKTFKIQNRFNLVRCDMTALIFMHASNSRSNAVKGQNVKSRQSKTTTMESNEWSLCVERCIRKWWMDGNAANLKCMWCSGWRLWSMANDSQILTFHHHNFGCVKNSSGSMRQCHRNA